MKILLLCFFYYIYYTPENTKQVMFCHNVELQYDIYCL